MIDCPECSGTGWTGIETVAAHGCDGTVESCERTCPVPEPNPIGCGRCQSTGKVAVIDRVKEIMND